MPYSAPREVKYEHPDGRSFTGTWHVEGDKVFITSPYGGRVEPLGKFGENPETVALLAFALVVGAYIRDGTP